MHPGENTIDNRKLFIRIIINVVANYYTPNHLNL